MAAGLPRALSPEGSPRSVSGPSRLADPWDSHQALGLGAFIVRNSLCPDRPRLTSVAQGGRGRLWIRGGLCGVVGSLRTDLGLMLDVAFLP